jgi:hypothetical protein
LAKSLERPFRTESVDSDRIITKESTHLFKDIYNEVKSIQKKYDQIVKGN